VARLTLNAESAPPLAPSTGSLVNVEEGRNDAVLVEGDRCRRGGDRRHDRGIGSMTPPGILAGHLVFGLVWDVVFQALA